MFQYVCTIFRENILPAVKNQVLAEKLLLIGSLVFKNWQYVLPADGTHVPKYVREAHAVSVLIRMCIYLVKKGVCWYKNSQNGHPLKC